jgi:50S ribosomal protein L16 3-hydroxylase
MTRSGAHGLLGGHTTRAFLARYWHKAPLLVRAAMPGFEGAITRDELFALAARDDVASRLVQRAHGRYTLAEGPFATRGLKRLPPRNWTLLVQGVNLHSDAADALLRRFAFIPYARLDDLMVSYAAPGGGVGPHCDSYDVFLLQGSGRRRWRYGRQRDLRLRPGAPLKILRRFTPRHDATLASGDMLYLPPDFAHDGIALDGCMTYSIGFRAPLHQELAEAFIDHLRDTVSLPGRYADPDLRATPAAGRIDARMRQRVARTLAQIRWDPGDVARFLGRYLTEPKPDVVFVPGRRRSRAEFRRSIGRTGVRLDRRTQLLYDDARYYINGDDAALPPSGGATLRRLADRRALPPEACAALPTEVIDMLHDWHRHGFLADAA